MSILETNEGMPRRGSENQELSSEAKEKQVEEMRGLHLKINMKMEKLALKASTIEAELQELVSKIQQEN